MSAMSLKQILKSAGVGILVAVLVLVIGVAGQMAWVVLRLPDQPSGETWTWQPISAAPPFAMAVVGFLVGFVWAFRRHSARVGS
jgi:hypothetical protein